VQFLGVTSFSPMMPAIDARGMCGNGEGSVPGNSVLFALILVSPASGDAAADSRATADGAPMTPPPDLSGRIALVTGASRGIGYFLARQLAAAGAHVVAVARTVGGLEELDDEIKAEAARSGKGSATLVPLDLTDMPALDRLGGSLNERWGKLDILVANAAVLGTISPIGHVEAKVFDKVMAVNVTSTCCGNRTPAAPSSCPRARHIPHGHSGARTRRPRRPSKRSPARGPTRRKAWRSA
jgi:hypothetical protein